MDYMFDAYIGMDIGEPDDIPKNNEPVIILGKTYNSVQGEFSSTMIHTTHILIYYAIDLFQNLK
jgi:hypothetical protein